MFRKWTLNSKKLKNEYVQEMIPESHNKTKTCRKWALTSFKNEEVQDMDPKKLSKFIYARNEASKDIQKRNLRSAHAPNVFLVLVFGRHWNVGLIKSKIVKAKLFHNYFTRHLSAITEFSIFWATLMYNI